MDTGCFRILLLVNSAVMNIGVRVSFQMGALIFLACVPQSGMMGSLSSSGFNVWEISRVSATAAVPAHVPAGCAGGLPLFSASLPAFVICRLSEANYFDRYEVTSHCGFDLRFSDDWWCGASFQEPVGHLCALFGDVSVQARCDASDTQVTLLLTHLPNSCLATPVFSSKHSLIFFCNMRFFFFFWFIKYLLK